PFPEEAGEPARSASRVPAAPPSIPDTEEGRQLRSSIRSAYRNALARFAAGELAGADAEALAPLLRFHQRLHEDATARRRLQGSSTVARDVFVHIAEACRDAGKPEVARRFETGLGMELLRIGSRSRAGQLLLRVLAEEPSNEPILLELAADAERRGARTEALGRLDALLAAQPDHREARLRRSL